MHAAGVVICPASADEYVPLSRGSDGCITTQFTMTTLEELGLLKMDFLGLRTLTVIQNAVKLIKRIRISAWISIILISTTRLSWIPSAPEEPTVCSSWKAAG